ncbi:putative heterokaryon incompatibility protein [Botrytis fragariae]|uniref:Putative heterokaryon incompatibility protein n=1 Tax=Botrytis fragariae TaxID=1964551 RepID=A0A8H6EDS2_9HELO|nr:putative heterokaryon incompatibility protein [Botrytis fragariae]KAF5868200.1 putative heterokaryon incompatibility protein [Botrytis fragariae]
MLLGRCRIKFPVTVNGKGFGDTANLFAAMQKLRKTNAIQRIWIDAICINQNDNDEKNTQVRLMRDIYQKTERCLIWLGEFEDAKPVTTMSDLIRKGKELTSASNIKICHLRIIIAFGRALGF